MSPRVCCVHFLICLLEAKLQLASVHQFYENLWDLVGIFQWISPVLSICADCSWCFEIELRWNPDSTPHSSCPGIFFSYLSALSSQPWSPLPFIPQTLIGEATVCHSFSHTAFSLYNVFCIQAIYEIHSVICCTFGLWFQLSFRLIYLHI